MEKNTRNGVFFALCAYSLWAIAPIYFKQLSQIEAMEILAYRVVWSLILTLLIVYFMSKGPALLAAIRNKRTRIYLLISTLLIAANWGIFIWAVQNDQMLSASLGYYINPLMNILLGMLFFADKLDRIKKVAAVLCLLAVSYEIVQFGRLPWIAIILASTFALYGLVRKKLGVDSFIGMALETGLLLPIAIGYLAWSDSPSTNPLNNSLDLNFLIFLAGPVTMVPLLSFAAAANRLSLTTLGFFQYIGPSGIFLLAVFVYNEPISDGKLITFAIIWTALALLVWDSTKKMRSGKKIAPASET